MTPAAQIHSRPLRPLPDGACDCHVHVFAPTAQFPMDPGRSYTPGEANASALAAHQRALGLDRVIVVQPSIYGTDNRATLDAIARVGVGARGIAVVEEGATQAELRALDTGGIRGLRLNLAAVGQSDPDHIRAQLNATAARCAGLGWHLQVFTSLAVIQALADDFAALPVPVMIDHFAGAVAASGIGQAGFGDVLRLLESGRAYVKIAAPYLVSDLPDHSDCAALVAALVDANPERIVWGSNWPHPMGGTGGHSDGIAPFRNVNDGQGLDRLADWLTPRQLSLCLADNPARLFGF